MKSLIYVLSFVLAFTACPLTIFAIDEETTVDSNSATRVQEMEEDKNDSEKDSINAHKTIKEPFKHRAQRKVRHAVRYVLIKAIEIPAKIVYYSVVGVCCAVAGVFACYLQLICAED